MSLNLTVASPRYVMCATDRRLIDMNTGKIITERPTKLTMLRCVDALALITYNGIGRYQDKTPADWLLELTDRVQLTSLRFKEVLQAIREEAEQRIASIPARFDRRHAFVLGAWGRGRTRICLISNYESAVSERTDTKARGTFDISGLPEAPGSETRVVVTGSIQDFNRDDGAAILRVAKKGGAAGIDIKNLCVKAIQNAVRRRASKGAIGTSVLWAMRKDTRKSKEEWRCPVARPFRRCRT